jgi:hypothetical protein
MANPLCDPATGRFRIPSWYASPCVKAWPKNADNGGATSRGVTATTIRIATLACDPNDAPCFAQQGGLAAFTAGTDQCAQDRSMIRAISHAYGGSFWGRRLEHVCVRTHGYDEVAQRADAIDVASKNVFAVLDFWAGGNIFDEEVAKRGVIDYSIRTPYDAGDRQPGYRWGGTDDRMLMRSTAEVICKSLRGRKAQWAGDAAKRLEERRFGLVHPRNPEFPPLNAYLVGPLKKCGVTLAANIDYDLGNAATLGDPAAAQQQAPLVVARLSSARINNVIAFTDPMMTAAMTSQATSQNYHPEWFQTGYKYQDSLAFANDQDQWSHAFGLSAQPASIKDVGSAPKWQDPVWGIYWWYYGNGGDSQTRSACGGPLGCDGAHMFPLVDIASALARTGPILTPRAFKDAMFSRPVQGGRSCRCATNSQLSFGQHGLTPWNDWTGVDDVQLAWYDRNAQSCSTQTGCTVPGGMQLLSKGERFVLGTFPTGDLPFFDSRASQAGFPSRPKREIPTLYKCVGCPSSGAPYGPA